jgi:hypothetical protein
MNTGQMLLTLGALMLLSVMVLRVNNNVVNTNSVLLDTKFGVLAVSLATSIVEEANKKAFDAVTDGDAITDVNLLTAAYGLGPNASEFYPNFNDFDDFNNYTRYVTNIPSAEFKIVCKVNYVNPSNLDGTSSIRTWHKKITVFVTSHSMNNEKDTVKVSSIYSYWFFR